MSQIEIYYEKKQKQEKSLRELVLEEEENDAWDQVILSKEQYIKKRKDSKWMKREVRTLGNYKKQKSLAFKSYQDNSHQKNLSVPNQISDQKQDIKQKLLEEKYGDNYWEKQDLEGRISEADQQYEESRLKDNQDQVNISNYQNFQQKSQSTISGRISKSIAKSYVKEKYLEYKYRWINSFVYLLAALAQGITVHTFTPIGQRIETLYKIEPYMVTLPALMFMVVSPPTMFFVNFISDKFGIKVGTSIGGVMLILGSGLKLLINQEYSMVIVGQALSGIGNSFIMNCPTKVASNWFKPANRGLISIVFALSITVSPILGVMIPPIFVDNKSNKTDVFNLILFEFIVTAVVFVAMLIFFKENPPSPPSFSATMKRQPFGPQLKLLFTNVNYYLLLVSMGFLLGGFASFISVISFYTGPYGYSATDTSIFVMTCTFVGIFSSSFVGIYVKRTKRLKATILIGLIGVCISFGLFQIVLEFFEKSVFLICLTFALIGFCAYPAISTILELGAEIAFPVAEATITGFLFAAQQLIGFLMGLVGSSIVKGNGPNESFKGYILFQLEFVISVMALIFVVEDFKRTRGEIKGSLHMDKNILDMDEEEVDQLKDQLVQDGIL